MAKPNAKFARILKQILLLAIPLILKTLKARKAKGSAASTSAASSRPTAAKAPSRRAAKAKKRKARRDSRPEPASRPAAARHKPSPIAELHRKHRSDVIITDAGVVVKVLSDDNEGSRHQRLLVEVDHTDITIKIAHNIDMAPRVPVREGDRLTFKGEYEYNDLGGVIHWTHIDPKKWREGGWIDHQGQRYE